VSSVEQNWIDTLPASQMIDDAHAP